MVKVSIVMNVFINTLQVCKQYVLGLQSFWLFTVFSTFSYISLYCL